jgi:hypothetical protein
MIFLVLALFALAGFVLMVTNFVEFPDNDSGPAGTFSGFRDREHHFKHGPGNPQ